MLRVQRGEGCSVIYDLVASFNAEKRKVNVGDAWFLVSLLSLCLSIGVLVRGPSPAFFSSVTTVEKFLLYRFSLLIGSDWVLFVCFFYREGHGLAEKLLLIVFIFLKISSIFRYALILCAETPFFHFEESLSTDNIRWVNALVDASCNHYFVFTIN